ncbi:MAG: protein kinase [Alphaproteobacteria bacterium]|nr:protein kinase [Alphaproteobacteria bacterium]
MAIPSVRLGPFLLQQPLGEGGMGTVWRARHPEGVDVAVKVLKHSYGNDPQAMRAFRAEVRAVASLDHPHIVRVFDYGVVPEATAETSRGTLAAGSPWLAMACAPDGTLGDIHHVESWDELLLVLHQVLDALAHSHARGIVHRDLKPRNVLLTLDPSPSITLTDFGIAHAMTRTNASHAQAGTPGYMAPEQIRGEWRNIGGWSDLYALGCLVFRLGTGRSPFTARTRSQVIRGHLLGQIPRLKTPFQVPDGFEDWVRKLLAKEPADRFACAADAAVALSTVSTGVVAHPSLPEDWRPRHPPTVARPMGTGLAMFVLRPWPLVGREEAQDALWRALAEVADRREPRLVVLEGDPGSGRSRLLRWLLERAAEAGAAEGLIVRGAGLREQIRGRLRVRDADRDEALTALRQWLLRHGSDTPTQEAVELHQELAAVGQPWTWTTLFSRLAARRPAILGLDDLDEADETIQGWMRSALASGTPTLVVATRRPGGPPLEGATTITLSTLSAPEQRRLVDAGGGLAPHLANAVVGRTSGNPGLAVRLVAEWAREGALVPTSQGYDLRGRRPSSLPPGVERALDERLAPLLDEHPEAARSLGLLAVLGGQRVRHDEWEAACRVAGVPTNTDEARAAGLVRSEGDPRGMRWSLEPALLADVLRGRLEASGQLAEVHHTCARALVTRHRAASQEKAAAHYFAAGRSEQARTTLRHLAEEALHHELFDRVAPLLDQEERVLAALELDEDHPAVLRWRIDRHLLHVLSGRGEPDTAALVEGRRSENPALAQAAWRATARIGDLSAEEEALQVLTAGDDHRGLRILHLARARALGSAGDLPGAVAACDAGLGTLVGASDRFDRDRLLAERTHWLVRLGHPDAEGAAMSARESCLARGRQVEAAAWLAWCARYRRTRGEPEEARELALRAQAELAAQGADTSVAEIELGLALVALRERDRAAKVFEGVLDRCTDPERFAVARAGWMACADPRGDRGYESLLDEPFPPTDPEVAHLLERAGLRALRAGSREAAVRALERAAEIYAVHGDDRSCERARMRVPRI